MFIHLCFKSSTATTSFGFKFKWSIHGNFQNNLGFPIGTILASFDPQVTPMLPTKFQVNLLFGSGEEAINRFLRWRPSGIYDRNDFSYF